MQNGRRPIGIDAILHGPRAAVKAAPLMNKTFQSQADSKRKIAVHDNRSQDTFPDSSLMQPSVHQMQHQPSFGLTDKLRHTFGGGFGVQQQRNDQFHVTATPFNNWKQHTSVDSSMLASGAHFYDMKSGGFHTQRHSLSQRKPPKKGSVAMNLDEDMKKFKTWQQFNKEFEKRLRVQEQANTFQIKRQKGDDFKFPTTLWRSP